MSHTYSENFIKNSDYFTGGSTKIRIGDLVTWQEKEYFIILNNDHPSHVKVLSGIIKIYPPESTSRRAVKPYRVI